MTTITRGRSRRISAEADGPGLPGPDDTPEPDHVATFASHEAESAVLAALLLESDRYPAVHLILPDQRMFFFDLHQRIYVAIGQLLQQGVTVDHVTLPEEVYNGGGPDPETVRESISQMVDSVTVASSVEFHAKIVRDLYDRRSTYAVVRGILSTVSQRGSDFRQAVSTGYVKLSERVLPSEENRGGLIHTIIDALDRMDSLWKNGKAITGLPLGIREFDALTHGFQPKHLVIAAARPGGGKTQLLLHLIRMAARMEEPWPVLVDTLEMSSLELMTRLLQAEAGINLWQGLTDLGQERVARDFMRAAGIIQKWPLEVDERCYTVAQLRMRVELWRRRFPHGPGLVGIDYLSHLRLDYSQGDRRDTMIGEQITRPLKAMARDLEVCVVLLCQINRGGVRVTVPKKRDAGPIPPLARPLLSDLKDSGDIEQDADQVIFIHPMGPNGEHAQDGRIELGLPKNRHGKAGWVDARFDGAIGRYTEYNAFQPGLL